MTSPNTDAPQASVPLGASEIASYVGAAASLAMSLEGKDWGIGANAQAIGLLGAALLVAISSISRAIKHHGAMHANAASYAAQMTAIVHTAYRAGDGKDVAKDLATATTVVQQATADVQADVPVETVTAVPSDVSPGGI
jgi:hypothetical protein